MSDLNLPKEMTRAVLAEQVAAVQAELASMREDHDAWRRARVADAEAEAISQCVKALDGLAKASNAFEPRWATSSTDIGRVLRYLASRYGVSERTHLEETG